MKKKEIKYDDEVKVIKGFYEGWYGIVEYKGNNQIGVALLKSLSLFHRIMGKIMYKPELIQEEDLIVIDSGKKE